MRSKLLGLLAIGLVFALLEGVASLGYFVWWARMHYWSPLPERSHTRYDPELGWENVKVRVSKDVFGPGLDVTTNARGFRNTTELAAEVPAGKTRVVALGDSFTLGYDVGDADAWPAWLEKLCPRLEVPNMGQSGYGIDQSYLWYERDAADFAHQVVVLAFIDDDLKRVQMNGMAGYGKPVLELREGKLVATNVPVPRAPYLLPALTQNLHLLEKLRVVELPRAIIAHFSKSDAGIPGQVLSDADAEQVDEAIFRALRASTEKRGSALVLVHLPHLETGRPSALAELPPFGEAAIARVNADGIPYADLADEMGRVPDPARRALFNLHSVENGPGAHYSPDGNRFVAAAIAARLRALGLIPADSCTPP